MKKKQDEGFSCHTLFWYTVLFLEVRWEPDQRSDAILEIDDAKTSISILCSISKPSQFAYFRFKIQIFEPKSGLNQKLDVIFAIQDTLTSVHCSIPLCSRFQNKMVQNRKSISEKMPFWSVGFRFLYTLTVSWYSNLSKIAVAASRVLLVKRNCGVFRYDTKIFHRCNKKKLKKWKKKWIGK